MAQPLESELFCNFPKKNACKLLFRQILMEGPLSLVDSGKPTEMFIILFDDMLLITRRKKALSKKVGEIFLLFFVFY